MRVDHLLSRRLLRIISPTTRFPSLNVLLTRVLHSHNLVSLYWAMRGAGCWAAAILRHVLDLWRRMDGWMDAVGGGGGGGGGCRLL